MLEAEARTMGLDRLWLFTSDAAALYAKAGWIAVETVARPGEEITIMRRDL